jgi:hypothetical protein
MEYGLFVVQSNVNECGGFKLLCKSGLAFVKYFEAHYVQRFFDCISCMSHFASDT